MKKFLVIFFVLGLLIFAVSGTVNAIEAQPASLRTDNELNIIDNVNYMNFKVKEKYFSIDGDYDFRKYYGEDINIYSISISINDDTKNIQFINDNLKVRDIMNELKLRFGYNLYYEGSFSDTLKNLEGINLYTIEHRFEEELVDVDFEEKVVVNNDLYIGVSNVLEDGVVGINKVVNRISTIGGVESREIVDTQVIKEPKDRVIEKGGKKIKLPITSDYLDSYVHLGQMEYKEGDIELKLKEELVMEATAYTAGYESTGKNPGDKGYGVTASGLTVRHGIVAVDPSFIPLGTKLYVEGYGYSIAADTGSAIKGKDIDLYFDDLDDAINFGRRDIKVYILE
jgi:3D (Asp-Asp-Asp) domain-containing protein